MLNWFVDGPVLEAATKHPRRLTLSPVNCFEHFRFCFLINQSGTTIYFIIDNTSKFIIKIITLLSDQPQKCNYH